MELLFQTFDELDDFFAAARHVLARYLAFGIGLERGQPKVDGHPQRLQVAEPPPFAET